MVSLKHSPWYQQFSNQGDQLQGGQDLTTQLLKRAAAKIPITPRVSPNIMSHDNRTSRAEKPKLRNTWWKFEQFHKLHPNDVTQERTSRAGQLTVVENLASFCWQPLVVSHWWINFKKTEDVHLKGSLHTICQCSDDLLHVQIMYNNSVYCTKSFCDTHYQSSDLCIDT